MTFNGFENPKENWSKLPHQLIEALPLMTSEAEIKVVLYILRHTWGFHESEKRISLDEFSKGRKRKDGTRYDNGTGISINAIRDGIQRAIEHGFIEIEQDLTDRARPKTWYSLKVSEVDSRVSEVDTQPSEVDTRSWKDTSEKETEKKTNSSDAKTASEGNEKPLSLSSLVTDFVTEQPQEQENLAEDLEELEYVLTDEDGNEPRQRPKWQIPDNDFQRDFLAVRKAKWFKLKQKSKVKKFEKCLVAGDVARDDVYRNCIKALDAFAEFPDRILPIPRSWYEWRKGHARENSWSVDGFINAVFDRDLLVKHCLYMLKKAGAPYDSAAEQPSDGVIRIGDGKMPLPPDGIIRI